MMTMKSLCWRQKLSARQKVADMFWFEAPKALILKNKSQIFKTTHISHSRLLPQKTFLPIPDSKCSNPLIPYSECSNSRWFAQGSLSVLSHISKSFVRKKRAPLDPKPLFIHDARRWGRGDLL